ncbi:hypothetical protein C806_03286 [Lachnospiraceae bacterium 3-1]|nr:hypothetical protein C806_03286 [Lachnospiraceae bacterium 3-1]
MNIQDKLNFFQQLIQCSYNLSLHSYDPELILVPDKLQTASAKDDDALILLSLEESIHCHINAGIREPLFIDNHLGLIWITAFEYENHSLRGIHTLGPAYSARNSYQTIKNELDRHNISVNIRTKIFRLFDQIPVIPISQLFQYAVMLHYCITGTKITTNDLHFSEKAGKNPSDSHEGIHIKDHPGIWLAEQELMNMMREGNPDYLTALARSASLSSGPHFEFKDSLRQAKSTAIILLTLCSRAAIEGGVSPSAAYTLNDYYIQAIEDSKNIAEASNVCRNMMEDYVQRVQQEKTKKSISGPIRSICDYIAVHIREKLSIAQLAAQAGYTEYYFSHKFKKEIGCSVAEYLKQEKIRQAKMMLSGTKMSIQEICDELSFGSRSYFSSSFQKETGISPSEYREKNTKF